jgi:membrane protein required for beta-lactamase induction
MRLKLEWYEAKAENLGYAFLGEVDRSIAAIREKPTVYARSHYCSHCAVT